MSWFDQAACRDAGVDLFFPVTKGVPDEAAALCRTCPVQTECDAYAERNATAGVWANRRLDEEPRSDGLGLRGRRSA